MRDLAPMDSGSPPDVSAGYLTPLPRGSPPIHEDFVMVPENVPSDHSGRVTMSFQFQHLMQCH